MSGEITDKMIGKRLIDLQVSHQKISINPDPLRSLMITISMSSLLIMRIIRIIIIRNIIRIFRIQCFNSQRVITYHQVLQLSHTKQSLINIKQLWSNSNSNKNIRSKHIIILEILTIKSILINAPPPNEIDIEIVIEI